MRPESQPTGSHGISAAEIELGRSSGPNLSRPGSIPAHAGEPGPISRSNCALRVYPRTRGGAPLKLGVDELVEGRSPHTRGSRSRGCRKRIRGPKRPGSIPAHAGEPGPISRSNCALRVYPRTRGGAPLKLGVDELVEGRSPHTRGSHEQDLVVNDTHGSIPAHAGEPRVDRPHTAGVYPRTRGGASGMFVIWTYGLSPHTRGSHLGNGYSRVEPRSIPAHAGEPACGTKRSERCAVYPRTRGGAPARRTSGP